MVEIVRTSAVMLHDDVDDDRDVKVEVNLLLFGLIVVCFYVVLCRDGDR